MPRFGRFTDGDAKSPLFRSGVAERDASDGEPMLPSREPDSRLNERRACSSRETVPSTARTPPTCATVRTRLRRNATASEHPEWSVSNDTGALLPFALKLDGFRAPPPDPPENEFRAGLEMENDGPRARPAAMARSSGLALLMPSPERPASRSAWSAEMNAERSAASALSSTSGSGSP